MTDSNQALHDRGGHETLWRITKYADDEAYAKGEAYDVVEIHGNLFLNEGIAELLDLACGLGSPTVFSNANARLGVGDSSTAEAATQTDLQAASNKTYKAMESGYPQRTGQTVAFRGVFGASDANYDWNELVIDNGAAAGKTWNRKVSAQGTKASGQTWTMTLEITIS